MGSGNFGGGGSVSWEIINSDGESGGGDKRKCKGKDKDPKTGGSFAVFANGSLQFTLPATKGNSITVVWGPESTVLVTRPPVAYNVPQKKKGARR